MEWRGGRAQRKRTYRLMRGNNGQHMEKGHGPSSQGWEWGKAARKKIPEPFIQRGLSKKEEGGEDDPGRRRTAENETTKEN